MPPSPFFGDPLGSLFFMFFRFGASWAFLELSGPLSDPRCPTWCQMVPKTTPKIAPKSCFFLSRSKMRFCKPLSIGIDVFKNPRHSESEENPIKNRAREQTLSDASFCFASWAPGAAKGTEKVPRRVFQGFLQGLWMQDGARIDSGSVLGPQGGPMTPKRTKMISK